MILFVDQSILTCVICSNLKDTPTVYLLETNPTFKLHAFLARFVLCGFPYFFYDRMHTSVAVCTLRQILAIDYVILALPKYVVNDCMPLYGRP